MKTLSLSLVAGGFVVVIAGSVIGGVDWLSIVCLSVSAGCLGFICGIEAA